MKRYLLIFFIIFTLSLTALGIVGSNLLIGTLNLQQTEELIPELEAIQKMIPSIYNTADSEMKPAIETLAGKIDEFRGRLAFLSVQRELYAGVSIYLALLIFITILGGLALWFGMMRIFIRPLETTVFALKKIAEGSYKVALQPSGAKEIRFLQGQVVDLAARVRESLDRIKTMERQHIGRYLVHQVRNSITPIRLCADVIRSQQENGKNRQVVESIDIITSETGKIEELISRFRYLYAFPEPALARVEITGLLRGILAAYPEAAGLKDDSKVYVQADAALLEQALRNLIDNAVEAAADSDSPGIETEVKTNPGGTVLLCIRDNGPGIAEEVRNKLFDNYVTTKPQGMGIGLSFVKKVMDIHGYRIDIRSGNNGGTEVTIELGRDEDGKD